MRLTYQNVILTIYPPHFSVFSGPRKDSSQKQPSRGVQEGLFR